MKEQYKTMLQKHGVLAARILIGGFFLLGGINKLSGIDVTVGALESISWPAPLLFAWIAAIFETLAGAAVLAGWRIEHAAILLALFVVLVSFLFHGPALWEVQAQQIAFMKNMVIVGALLYVAAYGPGTGWALRRH